MEEEELRERAASKSKIFELGAIDEEDAVEKACSNNLSSSKADLQ